jgi:hypothetical protein
MTDLTTRVDEHEFVQTCARCGWVGEPDFSESGSHIRANCGQCGRYLKFVKQNLSPEERAYWDER